ncbi:MAG: gamma-glutamyltransferase [Candidatus Thorarchaeota archaeon]
MVAASQPLATQAGVRVLKLGGNAVDAAVAVAAVLDVVEPFGTGCGGDAFALVHIPGAQKPLSFNGSGRAGSLVSLDDLLERGMTEIPLLGGGPVTVPGALHLSSYLLDNYGNLDLADVLQDAIHYAENGFPVSPIIARSWSNMIGSLQNSAARNTLTLKGRAPKEGETMKNPDVASVYRRVAEEGVEPFYKGDIAEVIVETVQKHGGFLTVEDMKEHETIETKPISTAYRGTTVYEHPPNGQGFAALEMLNIMEEFDFGNFDCQGVERYHTMIEAKKLAYADLYEHNADPDFYKVPLETLLSKQYARTRAGLIKTDEATSSSASGVPIGQDTVYLATADKEDFAVSFISSLYTGSGLVVPGTGIKLQNRGTLFSLNPKHPNCYAPRKRPFHTIIPGALYRDKSFLGVFGIMGGAHQAQAHAQVVSNLVDYNMTPQEAIDSPRFHHNQAANTVGVEEGVPDAVQIELLRLGHKVIEEPPATFGGGQAILRLEDAWIAGSDHRKDGMATGFQIAD